MVFKDRKDAGRKLALLLCEYKDENSITLALPRGGVVVAYEIAKELHSKLDIIVTRKIRAPLNTELAIGAVTQDGKLFLNGELVKTLNVTQEYINKEVKLEVKEAQRRVELYRKNRPPLDIKDKTIILVDDGVATGSTMLAAIESLRQNNAKKIIVAVPVASQESISKIKPKVDKCICIDILEYFGAVGSFYTSFPQVEDDEVIEMLSREI